MASNDEHRNIILCTHLDTEFIDSEQIIWLAVFLPKDSVHHICQLESCEREVKLTIRLDISTKEGAKEWLEAFQKSSLTTYRVERTVPCTGEKVSYRTDFRCQHRTKPRTTTADQRRGSKNTDCPAGLSIIVKTNSFENSEGKRRKCRSSDPHMPNQPMIVKIKCTHNHPLRAADALKHRDVNEDVKEKFLELFKNGYSPSKALDLHKYDLQLKHNEDYVFVSGDRAVTPDLQYCYRLYYQTFRKEYGEAKGELVLKELDRKIDEGSVGENDIKLKLIGPERKQAAIAIVTPLMKRVHKLIKHSGELVFIDASGNMDRQGCRVFLLLTHSCAGGLPLGVLVTTNETTDTVSEALTLYNSLLDDSAYFGRGSKTGPELFMTDDSLSERQALHAVYPDSTLLLCVFHILQAFWRFLWEAKNAVTKNDRPHLFSLLKDMVYCDTIDALETKYEEVSRDETLLGYQKVAKHMECIYARRTSWAISHRDGLNIRNNNTNNYAEAAMRIMKDQILDRTKAYNVIQLVDFITTRLETYYERRLIDVCNNRLDRVLQSRFLPNVAAGSRINMNDIIQVAENLFIVPSEEDPTASYMVDVELGVCPCKMGMTGGPCKHQYLVQKKFKTHSLNFIPVTDPLMRNLLYQVATGCSSVPGEWFQSLNHPQPVTTALPVDGETPDDAAPFDLDGDDFDTPDSDTPDNPDNPDDSHIDNIDSLNLQRSLQNQFDARAAGSVAVIPDSSNEEEDPVISGLQEAFLSLQESYLGNKEFLGAPMKAFTKQAQGLTSGTDSALASALHCFGKYSGVAEALGNKKRKSLVSVKTIGVQPTATARRKMVGGGRNRVGAGRPSNSSLKVIKEVVPFSSQTIPRRKAPHNLGVCVGKNQSLGKTHSSK